ncbi:MAG: fused MFS/spermidine synthase, partial [Coriobacteriales bacterium]|nr:fused MFS/spermidine synthase [Coriobacteriales bacterium]
RIGRSAGGLYAVSTAGSIAGTIGTAFWLIPLMSIETLVIAIGFVLFATAGLAFALRERETDASERVGPPMARRELALRWATVGMIGFGLLAGSTALTSAGTAQPVGAAVGEKVIYRKDTQYHRLLVTEAGDVRNLRFDRSRQSSMSLRDPYSSDIRYPDYLHLAMAAKPDAKRVLVVGLGGGTLIKRMWRDYPGVQVDAVEIDPDVVDVAKRYFALPDDPRVRITVQDGRRFIQTTRETYDVIVMDAYYDDALPFHLATTEFFREAKGRLNRDGVLIYNVVSAAEGEKGKLFRSMHRTASGVFGRIWVFPIGLAEDGDLDRNRNIVVLATDSPLTEGELRQRIDERVDGRVSVPGFETFDEDLYSRPIDVGDVPTLTDSHAPVDSLISVN